VSLPPEVVGKLSQMKVKYHAKTLSVDALMAVRDRIMDVSDIAEVNIWLRIPEVIWAAVSQVPLYNIPPISIEPVARDYEVGQPMFTLRLSRDDIVTMCEEGYEKLPNPTRDYIERTVSRCLEDGMTVKDVARMVCESFPPHVRLALPETVEIEFPCWRFFRHGVTLVVKPRDVLAAWPWLKDNPSFQKANFRKMLVGLTKCVYGVSS